MSSLRADKWRSVSYLPPRRDSNPAGPPEKGSTVADLNQTRSIDSVHSLKQDSLLSVADPFKNPDFRMGSEVRPSGRVSVNQSHHFLNRVRRYRTLVNGMEDDEHKMAVRSKITEQMQPVGCGT